jgi:hypothetical protein
MRQALEELPEEFRGADNCRQSVETGADERERRGLSHE